VTRGGNTVQVWVVQTSPSVALNMESQSSTLVTGEDPGFFTTVSSNGTQAETAVIWAVGRPTEKYGPMTLYALDASNSSTLTSIQMGDWPYSNANANTVPVVANGLVYVTIGSQYAILGLGAPRGAKLPKSNYREPRVQDHEVFGRVTAVQDTTMRLQTRNKKELVVDFAGALKAHRVVPPNVGEAMIVDGTYDTVGTLLARVVLRAKNSPAYWLSDK